MCDQEQGHLVLDIDSHVDQVVGDPLNPKISRLARFAWSKIPVFQEKESLGDLWVETESIRMVAITAKVGGGVKGGLGN